MTVWERIRQWCGRKVESYSMSTYKEALEAMKKETAHETPALSSTLLPSVGRVVLYTAPDGLTWPAIVVEIDRMQPTVLALTVFTITGPAVVDVVAYDEACALGTWRWPEFSARRSS